jgi:AraC family transcriptional regulator
MLFPKSEPAPAILSRTWDGLIVEYGRLDAVGEFDFAMPKHGLSVAFVPHEEVVWSVNGGHRQNTSLPAGSVFCQTN